MSKPLIHAKSSAKRFGGIPSDYMDIHSLMDSSKAVTSLPSHRIFTHQTFFISVILPRIFGETFKRASDGVEVSTRDIGEQHVAEDFHGFIPSASDYVDQLNVVPWMMNGKGNPPSHAMVFRKPKKQKTITVDEEVSPEVAPNDLEAIRNIREIKNIPDYLEEIRAFKKKQIRPGYVD
jgi:hypothetical protein